VNRKIRNQEQKRIKRQNKKNRTRCLRNSRRRIENRLRECDWEAQEEPMLQASNIHYEAAGRAKGLSSGGIGAIHQLSRQVGLIEGIDDNLKLLKVHLPYHESDHVLNIAYNILCGGKSLDDIELRRMDEVYLNALGAQRIPDPTRSGDFFRRFGAEDVEMLMDTINEAIKLCTRAGFKKITLRGDTAFSQSEYLDGWDEGGVKFVFGYNASQNLVSMAGNLKTTAWKQLDRPKKYEVKTELRERPDIPHGGHPKESFC
jgi:hypothetical protein